MIGFYVANYTQKGCKIRNGQWNKNYCVALDCREKENCGKRQNPSVFCQQLNIGDYIDSVYFWLGEPDQINQTHYLWKNPKLQSQKISAVIEENHLKSLNCL